MPTLATRARRSRRGQHLVVVAVVALVVATVVLVPLIEQAFSAALVDFRVRALPIVSAQVELDSTQGTGPAPVALKGSLDPRLRAVTDDPIATQKVVVTWLAQGTLVQVMSTADQCQHVRIVAGRCATGADEVMVSQGALSALGVSGLRVGNQVSVQQSASGASSLPARSLRVVGAFTARPDRFWGGVDPSVYTAPNPQRPQPNQTWLIGNAAFSEASPSWFAPHNSVRFPLRDGAVTDQTLPAAVAGAARTQATLPAGALFAEPLTRISQETATDLRQVGQLVPLLFVQLLILVLILAYQVFGHLIALRRPEVAVLKMRGNERRALTWFAAGEFGPAFAWALPVGLLVAYLAAAGVCAFILPGDLWPAWSWWALVFAVAAVLGAAAIAGVLWWRMIRSPIIDLMRVTARRRRGLPVAVVVAGAVAGAGVILAATGNLSGAPALLVPTMTAIVFATVLAASLAGIGSRLVRGLFGAGRATGALSIAQTVRRPGVVPVLTTLIIAATLLSFSTSLLARGDQNRQARATADVGAPVVVGASSTALGAVDPNALIAAVRKSDPQGRTLTPVVRISAASDEALTTVGVVPAEIERVAATDGVPESVPWDRLEPVGTSQQPNAITTESVGTAAGGVLTAPAMSDNDGPFRVTAVTSYIPGVPLQAVVADLRTILAAGHRTDNVLEYVWSSSGDPALLQRLRQNLTSAGFDAINVDSISAQRSEYDATATAWSMRISVILGAAAVLVALLSVATMVTATRRQRAIDLRSLAAAGVPGRALRRATVLEFLTVATVGSVLGAIAAPVGAAIVGDSLPWWSTPPEYPVTRTGFVWTAGLGSAAVLLAVLAVLAVVVGRRAVRTAGGGR